MYFILDSQALHACIADTKGSNYISYSLSLQFPTNHQTNCATLDFNKKLSDLVQRLNIIDRIGDTKEKVRVTALEILNKVDTRYYYLTMHDIQT